MFPTVGPTRSPARILHDRMLLAGRAMMVAFLLGWLAWFIPFDDLLDRRGTPLGADYAMFYVAGQVVRDGAVGQLYDQAEHQRRLRELFPAIEDDFCLPYRYPPAVALLMAPLASLPYVASFAVFTALSGLALCASAAMLAGELRILNGNWRKPVLWALFGWPVIWETLIGGQASLIGLLLLSVAVVSLRGGRFFLAGVVLGLAAYKPNLLALFILGSTLRYPRLLRGLVPAVGLVAALSLWPGGWPVMRDYLSLGTRLATQAWDVETPVWKVHSLASWLALWPGLPARTCCLGLGALVTIAVAACWRRAGGERAGVSSWALSLLVSVNLLFNPYTPIYDLTLLCVAGLLMAEGFAERTVRHGAAMSNDARRERCARLAQPLLAAIFFLPHASQFIAQSIGLQLFTLVLLGLIAWQAVCFAAAGHWFGGGFAGAPASR